MAVLHWFRLVIACQCIAPHLNRVLLTEINPVKVYTTLSVASPACYIDYPAKTHFIKPTILCTAIVY